MHSPLNASTDTGTSVYVGQAVLNVMLGPKPNFFICGNPIISLDAEVRRRGSSDDETSISTSLRLSCIIFFHYVTLSEPIACVSMWPERLKRSLQDQGRLTPVNQRMDIKHL